MDMQSSVMRILPDATELLARTANAIANARAHGIPVIYVVVGFRAGMPEANRNGKTFKSMHERMATLLPEEFMAVHPAIAPQAGDITCVKRRVSAFTGSDLEVVLRAQDIRHLVLAGVATSGVVLSTVREAGDKDFRITVLSDCCADMDEEVHRVLMTKLFPRQCDVMTAEEWAATV